jgi:hypothetical protein
MHEASPSPVELPKQSLVERAVVALAYNLDELTRLNVEPVGSYQGRIPVELGSEVREKW